MTPLRHGSGGQAPPRLAVWLIAREIDDRRGEDLLGDLDELFQARVIEHGVVAARNWYWRQAIQIIVDAARARRRQPKLSAGDSFMHTLLQDVRYAFRSLAAKPGFAAVAIAMLALGIGANATIFSWVNSVLLNPLPGTRAPHELVQVTWMFKGDVLNSFSYPDYQDFSRESKLIKGFIGRDDLSVGIVIDREAERAWSEIVTANYFDVMGVPMALGRGFVAEEGRPGTTGATVISHAYWLGRFNGDPSVIGRSVKINAQPFTIVGVAAAGFQGGESGLAFDLWLPMGTQPLVMAGGSRLEGRGNRWMSVFARLAPGVTLPQAQAELNAIVDGMRQTFKSENRYIDQSVLLLTLDNTTIGSVSVLRPVLLVLMAVAAVVLLIACANLAGLLLARASARQREIAIRLSMGAGRSRIVQQLLVEGTVLSALGCLAALIALRWTSGLLIGFAPPSELPIQLSVNVDARVVAFTAAVAVL
ncbi:MAG TPA: ABC transporter permease, partial [Vicinamibacterales bacterium]|nr:ABC transporter permease [Vicinamibacterales bacterium]